MLFRSSIGLALLMIAALCALAHEGATGIVLDRMKAMGSVGEEMKALTRLVRDKNAPMPEIARRARRIRELMQNLTGMFPPGSDKAPRTEATAAIWQNWSEFENMSNRVERYAAELATAAEGGDRSKARESFTALSDTCSSCHERFRVKSGHH
jgi:cytochrome c556